LIKVKQVQWHISPNLTLLYDFMGSRMTGSYKREK